MSRKPNIIIFNPDEMRWDTMGHMGNPAAYTPALDTLSKTDAVSFSNAYCQNPVCVPSRCSFFTGLYPHTTGHRTMGYLLREQETSLLKELKDAGYYVWANARNDLVAGQIPGLIESHVTELFCGGNAKEAPGLENPDIRGKRGDSTFYSFYNGELKIDENGKTILLMMKMWMLRSTGFSILWMTGRCVFLWEHFIRILLTTWNRHFSI